MNNQYILQVRVHTTYTCLPQLMNRASLLLIERYSLPHEEITSCSHQVIRAHQAPAYLPGINRGPTGEE
jgi:hypothetical protein